MTLALTALAAPASIGNARTRQPRTVLRGLFRRRLRPEPEPTGRCAREHPAAFTDHQHGTVLRGLLRRRLRLESESPGRYAHEHRARFRCLKHQRL